MDYQTFNQASFGFAPTPTPASPAHPPQHAQYADPHSRLQQQPNPAYGQYPNNGQPYASNMGGNGAIQPPFTQARPAALQQSYSGAPYSQALSSPAHHQFAPNTPSSSGGPPYALAPTHHPQHSPAFPPTPHTQHSPGTLPSNGQPQPMSQIKPEPPQLPTPVKAVPPSPVSPVAHARNQDRVATLLEINSILIREVCDLQSQGKAGQVEGKAESDKPKEYVDYMRRLQANLSYLAQNAEKPKPGQSPQLGPAIMTVPTAPAELVKLYQKLVELYPGWKGQTAQVKQSPGPQRINSSASIASQPPNSAGLQQNWSQTAMQNMQQAQAQASTKVEQ